MKQPYGLVPGTWAAGRALRSATDPPDYWEDGGALVVYLRQQGWENIDVGRMYWDGRLQGSPLGRLLYRRRFEGQWHIGWTVGGENISHMIQGLATRPVDPVDPADLIMICHSHGLQPLAKGLADPACPRIKGLLSVASPVRHDMGEIYTLAAAKVDRWEHCQMGSRDRLRWYGVIGAGRWQDALGGALGLTIGPEQATRRTQLKEYDHSEFINVVPSSGALSRWPERLAYLEGADRA
jgi:hypothetical protein